MTGARTLVTGDGETRPAARNRRRLIRDGASERQEPVTPACRSVVALLAAWSDRDVLTFALLSGSRRGQTGLLSIRPPRAQR